MTEEGLALLDTRASLRNLCAGGLQRIAGQWVPKWSEVASKLRGLGVRWRV